MGVSLEPWNRGMTQEVIWFLHHFHSDHFIMWILALADSPLICSFSLFSWCLTSAEWWWGCACPWFHSSVCPLQDYQYWCLVCDWTAHLQDPPWHFHTAPPSPAEHEFLSAGFYHQLGGPGGKQWEKGAEGERGKWEELKNSEGGAWEKILCGDWNDRARFLISPRFLIHSSPCSSHHVLSFPSFPWIHCNGFHLQDSVWHLWCCREWAVTECVFSFDGLAQCWRRPLFTGVVSELPSLQQILGLGFLHVRSQNGEVLLQTTSCTGTTGHCSNTVCWKTESWMDGWVTRGPFFHEKYCFMSLTFYFMLFWMFHKEQQNTFSVWLINTKPSFGHEHFLFHFPVRIKFYYMRFNCRTRHQYL